MALEVERRFLVSGEGWRNCAGTPQPLRQGYLAASAEGITVRMRLRGQDQAWLTLKAAAEASGLVRHEFEYPIPLSDAEALWSLAPHRLVKTRFQLDLAGGDWVVDCFEGENAPLVIADVTDKDGWIYAFDFAGLQSCHTEKMMDVEEATDFVRRRSWAPERSEAP